MALTGTQKSIVREIRALHARRAPLNISAVKRSHPKLMERVYAVRPFWGWKRALEDAGLSYSKINVELLDYVDCKICGRDFGALFFHLTAEHNIQPRDYARQYPDAELFCETARAKLSHSHGGRFKRSALPHWEAIWTPEYVLDRMAELHRQRFQLNYDWVEEQEKALTGHAIRVFGSWDEALRRISLDPEKIRLVKPAKRPVPRRVVALLTTRPRLRKRRSGLRIRVDVINALRQRTVTGKSLDSYSISMEDKVLYRAVRRHIGDFEEVYRMFGVWKPRASQWAHADKAAIIAELRRRKAARETLHSLKIRHTEYGNAFLNRAVALFGNWTRALIAAGIEPPKGTRPDWVPKGTKTAWAPTGLIAWARAGKTAILAEIRRRKRAKEPLRDRRIRKERAGRALLDRARALFGSWDTALLAAGFEPEYGWSPWRQAAKPAIVAELRRRKRAARSLRVEKIQSEKWGRAFFDRATNLFGTWNAALIAADIEPIRENSRWPQANKATILAEIRRRKRTGQSLSTTVLQRKEKWGGAFNARARVLFGSWRAALLAAGA